jgi:hypothetical protein
MHREIFTVSTLLTPPIIGDNENSNRYYIPSPDATRKFTLGSNSLQQNVAEWQKTEIPGAEHSITASGLENRNLCVNRV